MEKTPAAYSVSGMYKHAFLDSCVVLQHKNSRLCMCQYLVQICVSHVAGYVIAMTSYVMKVPPSNHGSKKRKLLVQMCSHTATVCIDARGQNHSLKRQPYGPSTDARQFADTSTTPSSPSHLPIKPALNRRCQWQVRWQAPRIRQLLGPEFMRAVHSLAQLPAAVTWSRGCTGQSILATCHLFYNFDSR